MADKVEVGQVWYDDDSRVRKYQHRLMVLSIEGEYARCEWLSTGRSTRIRLSRFKPGSYRLV